MKQRETLMWFRIVALVVLCVPVALFGSPITQPEAPKVPGVQGIRKLGGDMPWVDWLKNGQDDLLMTGLEHRQQCRIRKQSVENDAPQEESVKKERWFRLVADGGDLQGSEDLSCSDDPGEVAGQQDDQGKNLAQLLVEQYQFEANGMAADGWVTMSNGREYQQIPRALYILTLLDAEGVRFMDQGNMDQDDNVLLASIRKKSRLLPGFLLRIIQDNLQNGQGESHGLSSLRVERGKNRGDSLGELLLKRFPEDISIPHLIKTFGLPVDLEKIPEALHGTAYRLLIFEHKGEL